MRHPEYQLGRWCGGVAFIKQDVYTGGTPRTDLTEPFCFVPDLPELGKPILGGRRSDFRYTGHGGLVTDGRINSLVIDALCD